MSKTPIVLVVEDNAELRHVLKEALTAEGYQVLTARDDADALETLRHDSVHLLIADLATPAASDGIETVRQEFPDLPVVALCPTAGGHPSLFFAAWQSPKRYRTLPKPFRLRELLAVSREMLEAVSERA
ncbi:MAG TPA: response regulator [Longimicrobiales bacterium]|nr:response regulator [Longimicrobiales bacterium]